jgi:hypothetical protein
MLRTHYVAAVALALASSFVAAATLEDRIVGTWEEHVIDAISRIRFRPDHTMLTTVDSTVMRRGTWRIDGRTLIVDEHLTVPGRKRSRHSRAIIFELTRDRLITGELRPAVTFTRVR